MIGNDVVDLELARTESSWRREGFVQKIFTNHEQQLIAAAKDTACAIWDMWSRKEAAYKILNRETGLRRFIPLKLECQSLDSESKVLCEDHVFYTRTEITSDYIHTIAIRGEANFSHITLLPNDTPLVKIGALPHIQNADKLEPVSESHHGRFHFIVGLVT